MPVLEEEKEEPILEPQQPDPTLKDEEDQLL
jgi:hypothetical protein